MLDRVQDELAQCQLGDHLQQSIELLTQVRTEINSVISNQQALDGVYEKSVVNAPNYPKPSRVRSTNP